VRTPGPGWRVLQVEARSPNTRARTGPECAVSSRSRCLAWGSRRADDRMLRIRVLGIEIEHVLHPRHVGAVHFQGCTTCSAARASGHSPPGSGARFYARSPRGRSAGPSRPPTARASKVCGQPVGRRMPWPLAAPAAIAPSGQLRAGQRGSAVTPRPGAEGKLSGKSASIRTMSVGCAISDHPWTVILWLPSRMSQRERKPTSTRRFVTLHC
jgi:hypothetical protein